MYSYFSRSRTGVLIFCISVYFSSVADAFNLTQAKNEVKSVLSSIYGLIGESAISTASINTAGSLSALQTAADEFISSPEIDRVKAKARNPKVAERLSGILTGYQNRFSALLQEDPETQNEAIPLSADIDNISQAWATETES